MRRLLPLILLPILFGCARREVVRSPRAGQIVAEVLRAFEESERLSSLKAFGSLTGVEGNEGYWANFVLLYRKPGRLRLDLAGPLGWVKMSLVSDGERVKVYYPEIGELVVGRLSAFLSLHLEPAEIEKLILGIVEPPSDISRASVFSQGGSYILEGRDRFWVMEVDKRGFKLRKFARKTEGGSLLEVKLSGYRRVDEFVRPFEIEISESGGETRLKLKCTRQVVNEKLDDGVFELTVP